MCFFFMTPRKLFLIDSMGALLSAFMLGVVLVRAEHIFGMPSQVLFPLSAVASLFFLYSFTCYLKVQTAAAPFLRFIAIANFLYTIITLYFVCQYLQHLSVYGIGYFIEEAIIVLVLVTIEWRASLIN